MIKENTLSYTSPLSRLWRKIRPPQIVLTRFVETGCKFEITSRLEKHRVLSLGDEPEILERFLSELKPGEVVFDIGSCVGLYAIHAALLGVQVIAFEPDPSYRKRLRRNIKLNKVKKSIQVIDWAVSNRKGKTDLYTDGVDGKSPSLHLIGERGSVPVNTNTIDNAIEGGKILKPDLIKLDVEGAEILALEGMKETLCSTQAPRCLFIELHPLFLQGFNSSVEACKSLIESLGYTRDFEQTRDDQIHCIYRKRLS